MGLLDFDDEDYNFFGSPIKRKKKKAKKLPSKKITTSVSRSKEGKAKKLPSKKKSTSVSRSKEGKLKHYTDLLFKGVKKLEKTKSGFWSDGSPTREITAKSQKDEVCETQKAKCKICNGLFITNLVYHHIDGNRGKTVIKNLVGLCSNCHTELHKKARVKLTEWKRKQNDDDDWRI